MKNTMKQEKMPVPELEPETGAETSETAKFSEDETVEAMAQNTESIESIAPPQEQLNETEVREELPEKKESAQEELEKELEDALSENLEELYLKLPPSHQKIFKSRGEETVQNILSCAQSEKLLPDSKLQAIHSSIHEWLELLEKSLKDLNPYYVENETKIKTDAALDILERHGILQSQ